LALIDINMQFQRTTLKFDADIPLELLAHGQVTVGLPGEGDAMYFNEFPVNFVALDDGDCLLSTRAAERIMQMLMPAYGLAQVGFLIDGVFRLGEEVRFSNRLLNMSYDPLALACRIRPAHEKGAKVAVLTQCFNEGEMLLYWERFYGEQFGYENLYILNNASTDGSCQRLNPATNVINMPAVKVDHVEFAQGQGHFQRFLLMRYDWVLKIDADELIVIEGGLRDALDLLPPGTYLPELALEPVQNLETEAPFRFDGTVGEQRSHFIIADEGVIRPLLSSRPTTWTPGNHLCFEGAKVLKGLTVVHLKYFDINFLLNKNTRWSSMDASEREEKVCKHIPELSKLDGEELRERTMNELSKHATRERAVLPAWLVQSI
jgi:hypothetical protein